MRKLKERVNSLSRDELSSSSCLQEHEFPEDNQQSPWGRCLILLEREGVEVAWKYLHEMVDEEQLLNFGAPHDKKQYLYLKSLLLHEMGKWREASFMLERVLALSPNDRSAWMLAFKIATALEDEVMMQKALITLRDLGGLSPSLKLGRNTAKNVQKKNHGSLHLTRASRIKKSKNAKNNPSVFRKITSLDVSTTVKQFLVNMQQDAALNEMFEIIWKSRSRSSRDVPLVSLSCLRHPQLEKVLTALGFKGLYPFQREAIEAIRDDSSRDVLILAPTGAGKTEAALLPVISILARHSETSMATRSRTSNSKQVRVLILYPTKALSRDQLQKIESLVRPFSITVKMLDGDTNFIKRSEIFKNPPDIIISNLDMIHHHLLRNPRFVKLFSSLQFLIVDELHLYGGLRGGMLHHVIMRLRRMSNQRIQVIGMSATMRNPREFFGCLVSPNEDHVPFVVINATSKSAPQPQHLHVVLSTKNASSWYQGLLQLIRIAVISETKTLLFLDYRTEVERLYSMTRKLDFSLARRVGMHRAGLDVIERQQVERHFKMPSDKPDALTCLITTSTLEVGIDVGDVEVIITTPQDPEHLWQRIGRAGRKRQLALALIVLPPTDPMTIMIKRDPRILFRRLSPLKPFIDDDHLALIHAIAATRDRILDVEESRLIEQWRRVLPRAVRQGYVMRDLEGRYHVTKTGRSFLRHATWTSMDQRMIVYRLDSITEEEKDLLSEFHSKSKDDQESHSKHERQADPFSLDSRWKHALDLLDRILSSRERLTILTERELPRALHEFYPGALYFHLGQEHEILLVTKDLRNQHYIALAVPVKQVRNSLEIPSALIGIASSSSPHSNHSIETVPIIVKQMQLIKSLNHPRNEELRDGEQSSTNKNSHQLNHLGVKIHPYRVRLITMVVGMKKIPSFNKWSVDDHFPMMEGLTEEELEETRWRLDPPLKHVMTVDGAFFLFPKPPMRLILQHLVNYQSLNGSVKTLQPFDHPNVISGFLTMGYHGVVHLLRHALRIHLGLKEEDVTLLHVSGTNALFIYPNGSQGIITAILEQLKSLLSLALMLATSCSCSRNRHEETMGCPRCIHSRTCTVRNDQLHKPLAIAILQESLQGKSARQISSLPTDSFKGKLLT